MRASRVHDFREKISNLVLTPRSAISGYFESLGQDVDRFLKRWKPVWIRARIGNIRDIRTMHVYSNSKRQKLNFCRLPLSLLYNNVKIFALLINRRYCSIFLLDLYKNYKKSKRNQKQILPFAFAVNVVLNLSI